MRRNLAVTDEELQMVRKILAFHLPPGSRAYAFGSRATGVRLKPTSDLDLAVEGPDGQPTKVEYDLKHAFDESLLKWKVDVLDLSTISDRFKAIIEPDLVEIEFRSKR